MTLDIDEVYNMNGLGPNTWTNLHYREAIPNETPQDIGFQIRRSKDWIPSYKKII